MHNTIGKQGTRAWQAITCLCLIGLLSSGPDAQARNLDLDRQLGAENAQAVEVQMGLYDNKAMTEYVRKVGQRLVAQLDDPMFEFQFHIADDPTPNAFALPGGYIYVTRGILALMASEDELACVMAHEIIHTVRRHSIKQMRKSIVPRLLELPGRVVGEVVDQDLGRLLNAPIESSNKLLMASHSRKDESESDRLGVSLAAKAGYDPTAMNTILTRLSNAVELLTSQKETKSYFDDHPFTPDRVKNINRTVKRLSWQTGKPITDNFPAPLDSLLFGLNPAKGAFNENEFYQPEMDFAVTFPKGWQTINKPEAVGAIHEDRQAFIFVGLDDNQQSAIDLAKATEEKIYQEHRARPFRSEAVSENQLQGYVLSYQDQSAEESMFIHQLWVRLDDKMFKLIGVSPKAMEAELEASARSLRRLSNKERKDITRYVMQVVDARQGETFDKLAQRTRSELEPKLIAFINAIPAEQKLKKGQKIKIVKQELYD